MCSLFISGNYSRILRQVVKEILAEVFHARPGKVEEMIQKRMEERSRPEEREIWRISLPFREDYTFRKAYIL